MALAEQFITQAQPVWQAADLIEPVRDQGIPIPQHRLPVPKENNNPYRKAPGDKRKRLPPAEETHKTDPDGHIDEYV